MRKCQLGALVLIVISLGILACQLVSISAPKTASHFEQGRVALERGDYDQAVSELSIAVLEDQNNAEAHYLRGTAFFNRFKTLYEAKDPHAQETDLSRAIGDFSKAIELKPDYAEAYSFRGMVHAVRMEKPPALADYDKAIELAPRMAITYYRRAHLFETMGEREKAIADYKNYLRLSNDPSLRQEAEKRLQALQSDLS
jgi:Flp pilus assembly protein TadD